MGTHARGARCGAAACSTCVRRAARAARCTPCTHARHARAWGKHDGARGSGVPCVAGALAFGVWPLAFVRHSLPTPSVKNERNEEHVRIVTRMASGTAHGTCALHVVARRCNDVCNALQTVDCRPRTDQAVVTAVRAYADGRDVRHVRRARRTLRAVVVVRPSLRAQRRK